MAAAVGLTLAALLLVLLATPIQLHLTLARERSLRARVRVAWLFGLVRFGVPVGRRRAAREERTAEDAEAGAGSPRRDRKRRRGKRLRRRLARRAARGLLRADLRERALAFLRDVLRALRPRDVRLHARVGFDDPADTGRLWGLFGPLGAVLAARGVWLEPDFDAACLRLEGSARVRLIPAQLLFMTLAFLVSPPVLRALVAR